MKVGGVKEWKVEKILNKKEENLENMKKTVVEFEKRLSVEVRQ